MKKNLKKLSDSELLNLNKEIIAEISLRESESLTEEITNKLDKLIGKIDTIENSSVTISVPVDVELLIRIEDGCIVADSNYNAIDIGMQLDEAVDQNPKVTKYIRKLQKDYNAITKEIVLISKKHKVREDLLWSYVDER